MAGSRSLTSAEERLLVRHIRRLNPRNRALISAQLFLGFRISEILKLRVGHVFLGGRVRDLVALPPRFLKGGYGRTRAVPIGPELGRALTRYLARRTRAGELLLPVAPLFPSRQRSRGRPTALGRSSAEKIIKRALIAVGGEPHGLSTHSLRKSWAVRLYETSGHDLLVVRDGLGHRSVAVTQEYLPTSRARVDECIRRSDWTRPGRGANVGGARRGAPGAKPRRAAPAVVLGESAPFLPGLEGFAA